MQIGVEILVSQATSLVKEKSPCNSKMVLSIYTTLKALAQQPFPKCTASQWLG